jgi:hypothetical protein
MIAHTNRILLLTAALTLAASCRSKDGSDQDGTQLAAASGETDPAALDKTSKGGKQKSLSPAYSWEDGKGGEWRYFNKKMPWEEAFTKCDLLARTTKKRWRLPAPDELQLALKNGILSSKNPSFGWVYLNHTWTGVWENVVGSKVAVYVDMASGRGLRTSVEHSLSVVCLLTGESGGNDWTNAKTSQVWRYAGPDKEWSAADKICRTMARNDRLPWRLPTLAEIDGAIKHGIQTDANVGFGKEYLTLTWAAESNTQYGPEAYAIDLRNAQQYLLPREQRLHTLCVRPQHH